MFFLKTNQNIQTIRTLCKAGSLPSSNFLRRKSVIKHLKARNASSESAFVPNLYPHPDWIISSQSRSSDPLSRHLIVIYPQFSNSGFVTATNKLPTIQPYAPTPQRDRVEPSPSAAFSTTGETCHQRSRCFKPELKANSVGVIICNGSRISTWLNPG